MLSFRFFSPSRQPQCTPERIDISNTYYTEGPIRDSSFRKLPNLRYVDLGENVYTSTIPPSLSQLPNLQFLYMDNVYFDGVDQDLNFLLPMPQLVEAWMDFTYFVGGIPADMGRISTLRSLSLTFCGLEGPIPPSLGNIPNLDRIWLYQNSLTGNVPEALGNLVRVQVLYVEGNNLVGSMPDSICGRRPPFGILNFLGADCQPNTGAVACPCCTCCGEDGCSNFSF